MTKTTQLVGMCSVDVNQRVVNVFDLVKGRPDVCQCAAGCTKAVDVNGCARIVFETSKLRIVVGQLV